MPYLRNLLVLPSCDIGYREQPNIMSHAVWRRQEGAEDPAMSWQAWFLCAAEMSWVRGWPPEVMISAAVLWTDSGEGV